jgi:pimeloyl-ACP methyl ester carboxylesterase
LLYQVWMSTRLLLPNLRRIKAKINPAMPIHLFMGRYDNIIPLASGLRLQRKIPSIKLHIVDKGHNLLDDLAVQQTVRACLLSQTNSLGC